jgi:hypothetical protein
MGLRAEAVVIQRPAWCWPAELAAGQRVHRVDDDRLDSRGALGAEHAIRHLHQRQAIDVAATGSS